MITSSHVREEMKKTKKVVESVVASDAKVDEKIKVLDAKLKAIYKLVEVTLKVALTTRGNVVKVMEKLGVELVKPRRTQDNAEKTETKE